MNSFLGPGDCNQRREIGMQAKADTPHPCNYLVYGRRVAGSTALSSILRGDLVDVVDDEDVDGDFLRDELEAELLL